MSFFRLNVHLQFCNQSLILSYVVCTRTIHRHNWFYLLSLFSLYSATNVGFNTDRPFTLYLQDKHFLQSA